MECEKFFHEIRKQLKNLREKYKELIAQRKERISKSASFEEPDRVPVQFTLPIDWWLEKQNIPWSQYLNQPRLQFKEHLRLAKYNFLEFDADIDLPTGYEIDIDLGTEVVESSVIGCRIDYREDDYPWLDLTWAPLASSEDIKKYKVPEGKEMENIGIMPQVKKFVDYAHEYGFKVTGINNGEGPFEMACFSYGTNNFLVLMKEAPALAKELMEKMTQLRIKQSKIFEKWFDHYEVIVGENNIDMISAEQFAEFVFPYDKNVFKSFPNCIPQWHTDACADRFFDIIPEYGIKSFEVSDTTDLKLAKQKLASHKIVLTGNLPQNLFVFGTPEDVERETIKCIEAAASGGGYILTPNSLMRDVKEKNLKALVKAVKKYGKY